MQGHHPPPGQDADCTALRYQWAVLAALLRRGLLLDGIGSALWLLGLLIAIDAAMVPGLYAWGAGPWWKLWLALGLLAGGVQKYLAVRTALDADLFAWLACHAPAGGDAATLIDQALTGLRLRQPTAVVRAWPERHAGGRRLLAMQALALGAQALLLVLAVACA